MLQALAEGETDAAKIAALATHGLQASQEALQDALSANWSATFAASAIRSN